MKFCRIAFIALTVPFLAPVAAWASITFKLADYTISALSADPGLVIQTAKLLDTSLTTYDFTLTGLGSSHSVDLFDIWTNESTVNFFEDTVAKPISVDFSFSEPPPPFTGGPTGETDGVRGSYLIFIFPFSYGEGVLEWDGPEILNFGPNGDGQLQVALTDATFNRADEFFGDGPLNPGRDNGATVAATFTLLAEPTGGVPGGEPGVVPEPGAIAVWLGMLAIGMFAARRPARD